MGKAEEQIRQEITEREKKGLNKYNQSTDRSDLTILEWLQHSKEELLDGAVYNQVLMNRLKVLKNMCEDYKVIRENKHSTWEEELSLEMDVFQEAMKLMLGDGIMEYLNQL